MEQTKYPIRRYDDQGRPIYYSDKSGLEFTTKYNGTIETYQGDWGDGRTFEYSLDINKERRIRVGYDVEQRPTGEFKFRRYYINLI